MPTSTKRFRIPPPTQPVDPFDTLKPASKRQRAAGGLSAPVATSSPSDKAQQSTSLPPKFSPQVSPLPGSGIKKKSFKPPESALSSSSPLGGFGSSSEKTVPKPSDKAPASPAFGVFGKSPSATAAPGFAKSPLGQSTPTSAAKSGVDSDGKSAASASPKDGATQSASGGFPGVDVAQKPAGFKPMFGKAATNMFGVPGKGFAVTPAAAAPSFSAPAAKDFSAPAAKDKAGDGDGASPKRKKSSASSSPFGGGAKKTDPGASPFGNANASPFGATKLAPSSETNTPEKPAEKQGSLFGKTSGRGPTMQKAADDAAQDDDTENQKFTFKPAGASSASLTGTIFGKGAATTSPFGNATKTTSDAKTGAFPLDAGACVFTALSAASHRCSLHRWRQAHVISTIAPFCVDYSCVFVYCTLAN